MQNGPYPAAFHVTLSLLRFDEDIHNICEPQSFCHFLFCTVRHRAMILPHLLADLLDRGVVEQLHEFGV
jgi:hypothetical protein